MTQQSALEKDLNGGGSGAPETGNGNWVKGRRKEFDLLHPDFDNPQHDPHWDYESSEFPAGVRIYPDGWEHKVP
ncbi:MAG: hypothetical protein SP4CHLAM5_01940 [Chlamydiia bacterium]|nr:hypothetical protein [Chlamydiia bacterium]MCH9618068.1 hypothetical protein [Chlamydiia bacterium]MCH9624212.1 hypothetical protein [Chlamydiia bacterium]